jgi:hypothetical protein
MSGRDEMDWRRAEQRLFADRAAVAPAPPPFGAVLAAARRDRARAARRRLAPWVALGLAAAIAGLYLVPRATRDMAEAPAVLAEPPSFACYDDPGSLVVEAAAYATDRAIASAEDHYAACLVGTPASAAGACGLSVVGE